MPDVDTVRPPGEGGEDAYNAETVVRTLPPEMLRQYAKALRPAALPKIAEPSAARDPGPAPPADLESTFEPPSVPLVEVAAAPESTDLPHFDHDDDEPLSAHAAVSTRHPGEELATADDDAAIAAQAVGGSTKAATDKRDAQSDLLGLWIGLGLIAAVAVGLLLGQCK